MELMDVKSDFIRFELRSFYTVFGKKMHSELGKCLCHICGGALVFFIIHCLSYGVTVDYIVLSHIRVSIFIC